MGYQRKAYHDFLLSSINSFYLIFINFIRRFTGTTGTTKLKLVLENFIDLKGYENRFSYPARKKEGVKVAFPLVSVKERLTLRPTVIQESLTSDLQPQIQCHMRQRGVVHRLIVDVTFKVSLLTM